MTGDAKGWTEPRVALLTRMWREGLSAGEVARALGVTRNAVLGKVHRLKLSQAGRAAPARPRPCGAPPGPVRRRTGPAAARPRARRSPPAAVEPDAPGLATLLTLEAGACRWPIGDPLKPGFAFCGRAAARGSYCEVHASRAFAGTGGGAGRRVRLAAAQAIGADGAEVAPAQGCAARSSGAPCPAAPATRGRRRA